MRLFLGTIIVIISMLITAFNFWYFHYHMVVFGRGLLEALPSERMVAFTFTSFPFLAAIYLSMRHLIFESSGQKRRWIKKKWTTAGIAAAFGCLAIFWFPLSNFTICLYYTITQEGTANACDRMESDAHNTVAAISSYFADPDHMALPTVDQLIEQEDLSLNCRVELEENANGEPIITVIDDTAKCRKGMKYVYHFDGSASEWIIEN